MAAPLSASPRLAGRRQRHRPMAEINVTPFVDVMLVLLVIFMVAAPLLTVGVPLELPKTAASAVPAAPQEPLTLSITRDGPLVLMESEVPETELVPRLTALIAARGGQGPVFIRGDAGLPYGRVMQVMGALNAAGFTDLVLVTEGGGPRMGGGPAAAQPAATPAAPAPAAPAPAGTAPAATAPATPAPAPAGAPGPG